MGEKITGEEPVESKSWGIRARDLYGSYFKQLNNFLPAVLNGGIMVSPEMIRGYIKEMPQIAEGNGLREKLERWEEVERNLRVEMRESDFSADYLARMGDIVKRKNESAQTVTEDDFHQLEEFLRRTEELFLALSEKYGYSTEDLRK